MTPDDEIHDLLGAYVAGGLEEQDRVRFASHLKLCSACRIELEQLIPVAAKLKSLDPEFFPDSLPLPPRSTLDNVLASIATSERFMKRKLRTWRLTASLAGALAVVMGAYAIVPEHVTPPQGVSFHATAGIQGGGTLSAQVMPWGTQVTMKVWGLPTASSYVAYAVTFNGVDSRLCTWGPTANHQAKIQTATSLKKSSVRLILITTPDGNTVMRAYL